MYCGCSSATDQKKKEPQQFEIEIKIEALHSKKVPNKSSGKELHEELKASKEAGKVEKDSGAELGEEFQEEPSEELNEERSEKLSKKVRQPPNSDMKEEQKKEPSTGKYFLIVCITNTIFPQLYVANQSSIKKAKNFITNTIPTAVKKTASKVKTTFTNIITKPAHHEVYRKTFTICEHQGQGEAFHHLICYQNEDFSAITNPLITITIKSTSPACHEDSHLFVRFSNYRLES